MQRACANTDVNRADQRMCAMSVQAGISCPSAGVRRLNSTRTQAADRPAGVRSMNCVPERPPAGVRA
eukprot:8357498-Alexandrium_andersonii.AAC.1